MNYTGNPEVHFRGHGYSNRSYITLQGCTSSHTLSLLTAVYTTCTRQPSSGSPARVSAMTGLTTQVPSLGLSPIWVPSVGRSGRGVAHGPKRCVQGSRVTKRALGTPGHVPAASQPTRGSALRVTSSKLQTPETSCNSWTEDKGS